MALAFRSSSTGGNGSGTTLTVSAPAGMASGDLAIAVVNVLRNGIIRGGKGIELPNHRAGPGTANTVTNVVDENGDPVTITYHNRPIG